MNEIDRIENGISLLDKVIDFEEIINGYLSVNGLDYSEDGIDIDPVEFRTDKANSIIKRFSDIYDFNIITPENGFCTLSLSTDENVAAKKYLHRFLTYKNRTGGDGASSDGSAILFEKISANAVKNYLGDGSQTILIGENRERLTEDVLKQIATELNENPGVFNNLPIRAQDDGVDFIVYKAFDDRNIGNVIILGQACVGKHYQNKKEIYQRWKDEYISYAVKPPITLLSIVSYLDSTDLRVIHSQFGNSIVFDRGRIMRYYDSSDIKLNVEIQSWVEKNINEEE